MTGGHLRRHELWLYVVKMNYCVHCLLNQVLELLMEQPRLELELPVLERFVQI